MLPDLPPEPPALTLTMTLASPPAATQRSKLLPGTHTAPTFECLTREAQRNSIDPYVLLAVMKTENGRPGEVALNRNGTNDLGPMSVNTVWIPHLAKHYRVPESELAYRLASDGCANVAAGAFILRQKIVEAGGLWEGVARFHSKTPGLQGPYLMRVYARLQKIVTNLKMAAAAGAAVRE